MHEEEDRIFVAIIPQKDFDRPGVAACELALAPEALDDYRTRIDTTAKRNGRPNGKLASNRVIKDARGERLETIWEFHPDQGGFWREVSVRMINNRQLYTFILNVEDSIYAKVRSAFDALVAATTLHGPQHRRRSAGEGPRTGGFSASTSLPSTCPTGWAPVLAPSEVALLFADGPPHGVWSDNLLVLAHPHRKTPTCTSSPSSFPTSSRRKSPSCEVISCQVVAQDKIQALETVVRTQRGPFSMTVIERRFRGGRFDYEVKYTVESKRFDELVPKFRKSFDSFREFPGDVPGAGAKKAA